MRFAILVYLTKAFTKIALNEKPGAARMASATPRRSEGQCFQGMLSAIGRSVR